MFTDEGGDAEKGKYGSEDVVPHWIDRWKCVPVRVDHRRHVVGDHVHHPNSRGIAEFDCHCPSVVEGTRFERAVHGCWRQLPILNQKERVRNGTEPGTGG